MTPTINKSLELLAKQGITWAKVGVNCVFVLTEKEHKEKKKKSAEVKPPEITAEERRGKNLTK